MNDAQSIPPRDGGAPGPGIDPPVHKSPDGRQLVHAAAIADAGQVHAPGALLLDGSAVVACGAPETIGSPAPGTTLVERHDALLLPPLVNAHVHLDLTTLPAPAPGGAFGAWLAGVGSHRGEQQEPGLVEQAVAAGVEASLAGGCAFVGDICGSRRALEALRSSSLGGIGYLEFLGHEQRALDAVAEIETLGASDLLLEASNGRLAIGLSPHALYSTGPEVYRAAAAAGHGCRVATHLAESLEEEAWCRDGSGMFGTMLDAMGYAQGRPRPPGSHPVDVMLPLLHGACTAVVHLNYIEPRHVEAIAASGVTVVYCPRASRYFGHPKEDRPRHAWRELIACGVPVALGTDGRPCLPGPGLRGARLSVLDDALCLAAEEDASLEEWLPMATLHGARALGIHPDEVTFTPGRKVGVIAVSHVPDAPLLPDPESPIEWIFHDADAAIRTAEEST